MTYLNQNRHIQFKAKSFNCSKFYFYWYKEMLMNYLLNANNLLFGVHLSPAFGLKDYQTNKPRNYRNFDTILTSCDDRHNDWQQKHDKHNNIQIKYLLVGWNSKMSVFNTGILGFREVSLCISAWDSQVSILEPRKLGWSENSLTLIRGQVWRFWQLKIPLISFKIYSLTICWNKNSIKWSKKTIQNLNFRC